MDNERDIFGIIVRLGKFFLSRVCGVFVREFRDDGLSSARWSALVGSGSPRSFLFYPAGRPRSHGALRPPPTGNIHAASHVATRASEDILFGFRDQRGSEGTNSMRDRCVLASSSSTTMMF